jgi:hypothetical protein
MKRIGIATIVAFALVFAVITIGAQSKATLSTITGKVEIQSPGEQAWKTASVGMEVPVKATISTGFGGRAVLQLGASTLTVGPLTRLRIDELSTQNNVARTSLSMPVGRVRADVKSSSGAKNDFTVKSALSTAAVRGTGFETDGALVTVFERVVAFYSASGVGRDVGEGESGLSTGGGAPSGGANQRDAGTLVNTSTSTSDAGSLGGGLPGLGYGDIAVTWH